MTISAALRETVVIALFRQVEEWGEPTIVAFEAGKQVSEKAIPIIVGQLQRTAPRWRDFWYPAKRRVDALSVQELFEQIAASNERGRHQVSAGLVKIIESTQILERLTNRDWSDEEDERERYWQSLLPWADQEIGFELREATSQRQGKTTAEFHQAAGNAARIAEMLSQALDAVPVEHPSHRLLSVASMDADTFSNVLRERADQAEMRDEYGMNGARGGHRDIGGSGERIDYTPEPDHDDGSKPDYDDHDLEDRDPYY